MRYFNEKNLTSRTPRQMDVFTKMTVHFGGVLVFLGWIFTGAFGLAYVIMFSAAGGTKYLSDNGEWEKAMGTVKYIEETNTKVNRKYIYEYQFNYSVAGKGYTAASYDYRRDEINEQMPVKILYKKDNPERAKIEGMDETMLPPWVPFIFLIPVSLGLVFVIIGHRNNRKSLDLLLHGLVAKGKMISKNVTNTRINNRMVYAYEFEFEANNEQRHIARCRTHLTFKVEDEDLETIVYDRKNPDRNVVYDAIAAAPEINSRGEFEQAPFWRAALFIAPAFAILGIVLAAILLN